MRWLDNLAYAIMALGWVLAAALVVGTIYSLVRLARYSWRQLRSADLLVRLASAAVLLLLASLALAYPVAWVHYTFFWLPANQQQWPSERQSPPAYQNSLRKFSF